MMILTVMENVVLVKLVRPFNQILTTVLLKRHKENKAASFKRWFADYKWLSFCTTRNVVFCYYCHTMTSQGKLTLSKKCDEAFSSRGYDNWKKAIEKFKEHEKSQGHHEACMKYKSQKGPSVIF